jgi:hypothetical protein
MKLLKLLLLPVLCMGLSVAHAAQMPILNVQSSTFNIDVAILDGLYKTYDQYKDNFVNYLPTNIPVNRYKLVLLVEQERLKSELNSLSYKNIIFSWKNLAKAGVLVGSELLRQPDIRSDVYNAMMETVGKNLGSFIYKHMYFRGSYVLQAVAGFTFIQEIKAFQDKKKNISEQIDKCNKMLALLEKE